MSVRTYDSYYDDPFMDEKPTKKTGKSSTRRKSTEPTTENGVICNAVCVKVREAPDPSSKATAVVNAKEKVKILDQLDNYYKIEIKRPSEENPVIGYILLDFCKKED